MEPLADQIDAVAREKGFSGVVRVDRAGDLEFVRAYGLADRAHAIPNTIETRFAIASGVKGWTALTVMSLVEEGTLGLEILDRDGDVIDAANPLAHAPRPPSR